MRSSKSSDSDNLMGKEVDGNGAQGELHPVYLSNEDKHQTEKVLEMLSVQPTIHLLSNLGISTVRGQLVLSGPVNGLGPQESLNQPPNEPAQVQSSEVVSLIGPDQGCGSQSNERNLNILSTSTQLISKPNSPSKSKNPAANLNQKRKLPHPNILNRNFKKFKASPSDSKSYCKI